MPRLTATLPLVLAAAAMSFAGDGMRPRGAATDYPAHEATPDLTIAAAIIPADQLRKQFSVDVDRLGYIVVEIAVYPEKPVTLSIADFMLRSGESSTARPVSAESLATILDDRPHGPGQPRGRGPNVDVSETIGVETGTYDPNTGRKGTNVYTGSGVGVGNGRYPNDPRYDPNDPRNTRGPMPDNPPPHRSVDRATMEEEFDRKALPETRITEPIAGYLYFPKPSGKSKKAPIEITYYGADSKIKLTVPAAK